MMFRRDIEKIIDKFAKFPVVAILGPRQAGKTTLAQNSFKNHRFISFENPTIREFALSTPIAFLKEIENDHGVILDEFQYVPQILSYIQLEVDAKKRPGYFVLTGSQNFLMNEAITQSLAGRVGILTLLPLSIHEFKENDLLSDDINKMMFFGCYPRIYAEGLEPNYLYSSYIQTYLERDVRQLSNIGDLRIFQKFMKLCAGRIGQLLNLSDIATNCSVSVPTVSKWLSILEESYIICILRPHFNNFNKRLTKAPKIFFYDTGLACNLLEIDSSKMLALSPFRGHLFENFIISDFFKQFFNIGRRPPLYFWRDQNGRIEIDCIIDLGARQIPIEIKSAENVTADYFKNIADWNEFTHGKNENAYMIYTGLMNQVRAYGNALKWQSAGELVDKLTVE